MILKPRFLTPSQVLLLHKIQIDLYGGLHGLKSEDLLLSALGQPESGFADSYFHADVFEMASAYLFHLVKNHAFNDGNKWIAALAASVFLQTNGFDVSAGEEEFEKLVLDAAEGSIEKKQIADFFRRNTTEQN